MRPVPFDLNLRHLAATAAIVAKGNMSAAAESVSLSQPALTQGLAKLESQVGALLFHRRPDGMAPTAAGRILAERVAAALRHLAEAGRGGGRGFARPERLMTSTQLRAFLAMADAGSFTVAAARTGLSQPAIHRATHDLEQILAVPLAERRGRGIALTDAGRRMARAARLASGEIAAALDEIAGGGAACGSIAVGAMPLCRARLLPHAIVRFARIAPSVQIRIVEGSWRDLVEPLRDGAIDLMVGALRDHPAPADLAQAPLFIDRLVVVAGSRHPLAGPTLPSLARLAGFPWIVGSPGSPLRGQWEALFEGAALPPAPFECGSVMTIRGILRETDCLTLLSPDQVSMEVERGELAHVGGKLERCVRTIGVTHRAGWRLSTAQRLLLGCLEDAARAATAPVFE